MDWRQYAMSFWNDYQMMINMQLAMCQMLANNQQQQQPPQQQQKKALKRLTHKRERKVMTNDQRRLTTETEELLSPRMLQDYYEFEYRPITSEIMENYLAKRCHRTMTIYHAKVAQKSYGNEKRFFCPPPCIYLSGADWTSDSISSSFHEQESFSAKIGINDPINSLHHANWQNLSIDDYGPMKYGSARTLFISDSDKRKYIHLNIELLGKDSTRIGIFPSRKIKIISKPSKKKQSVKNIELCIQSGTNVTLFNRLRSQNVSTRFLHIDEDEQFYASAQQWGSFLIYLVENNDGDDDRFSAEEKCIQYGSTVKFVCSKTNRSLPHLIIRKVDKNRVLIDCVEPVSQLHKCAFELKNSSQDYVYLAIENERIIKTSGKLCSNEPFRIDINDSACWTIISTDKIEYKWYESQGPVPHPITPIPIANQLIINNEDNTRSTVEITGENFSPSLSVWFGEIESPLTEYQSTQTIIAEVPHSISNKSISFVRRDGIIYPTSLTLTLCI